MKIRTSHRCSSFGRGTSTAMLAVTRVSWLLLCLASWPSVAAAQDHHQRTAARVHSLLAEWRWNEAEALLTLLRVTAPKHQAVALASARLHYLRGDYRAAYQLLRRTLGDPKQWKAPLALQVAAVRDQTRDFVTHRSPSGNFVISHPPGREAILVPYALGALEKARSALKTELGLAPDGPVRVEILPGPETLAKLSPLTEDEVRRTGTIALCRDHRIMIVTPRALVTGYGWLDTLAHEYVHYLLEVKARHRVPLWLHEGIARFAQERWRRALPTGLTPLQAHRLADGLARGALVPLRRMVPSFAKLRDQREAALAFAQVASMVLYLHRQKGSPGLERLLVRLAAGDKIDRALRGAMGFDLPGLMARWRVDLGRQRLLRVAAYEDQGRRYRSPPKSASLLQRSTKQEPRTPLGRYRRLGSILRTRGHLKAAVVAYRRAFRESGHTHGRTANTLARLLVRLGLHAEALKVVTKAIPFSEDLAALHVAAARAAESGGNHALAVKSLWAANAIDPFDPEIHCRLAWLLGRSRDPRASREKRVCRQLRRED